MRESDDRNAEDEGDAADDHERLAPQPVGDETGKQRRNGAPEQYGGDDDGKLARRQLRGSFQVRQRAANDSNIDTIEQAAKAGHEHEKEAVFLYCGCVGGDCIRTGIGHDHPDGLRARVRCCFKSWSGSVLQQGLSHYTGSLKNLVLASGLTASSAYNDRIQLKRSIFPTNEVACV
jgi:hypothetical protein